MPLKHKTLVINTRCLQRPALQHKNLLKKYSHEEEIPEISPRCAHHMTKMSDFAMWRFDVSDASEGGRDAQLAQTILMWRRISLFSIIIFR